MTDLDRSHDPARTSWVESANDPSSDFPIQNLPLGVFTRREGGAPSVGIAIGSQVLDVVAALEIGLLTGVGRDVAPLCAQPSLNALIASGRPTLRGVRLAVSDLLGVESGSRARGHADRILVPAADATLRLPVTVGDYTDFYASIHHATNVGSMFRPDNPLLPNYKHMPIGYHGRASSVVVSGTAVTRPSGQTRDDPDGSPSYGPTRRLDYELEVGAVIGAGNALGIPISIESAEEHIAGLCLINDWSARDVQTWEYQPLGPFLAKSFATSASPWLVTLDALLPFRVPAFARPHDDPTPPEHLRSPGDLARGGFDIALEVSLRTQRMRAESIEPFVVSRGGFRNMYWTFSQMVAHHTSNGCNLRPGDLLASGTVSGPNPESRGCLLERTWRGRDPLQLPNGETRTFLVDGDEIVMRGYCEREGARRIGFGECRGVIVSRGESGRR